MSVSEQLLNACEDGDLRLVKKLLRRDPSLLNKQDKDGWNPLLVACQSGREAVVQYLLGKGAAVDINRDGITPLLMACQRGREGTARLLLENGAAIDLASHTGSTPLPLSRPA